MNTPRLAALLLATAVALPVAAQPVRTPPPPLGRTAPPAATPAQATSPAPAPVPNEPQRTTSTFGDWILRCERPDTGPQTCEIGQTLFNQQQPVAQTAIGRLQRTDPFRMTVLVPVNVTLTAPVRMVGLDGGPLEMTWRRCVPAGCLADLAMRDDILGKIRTRTENAKLVFQDAATREATLPFSPRGLPQALDALAKEEQR